MAYEGLTQRSLFSPQRFRNDRGRRSSSSSTPTRTLGQMTVVKLQTAKNKKQVTEVACLDDEFIKTEEALSKATVTKAGKPRLHKAVVSKAKIFVAKTAITEPTDKPTTRIALSDDHNGNVDRKKPVPNIVVSDKINDNVVNEAVAV